MVLNQLTFCLIMANRFYLTICRPGHGLRFGLGRNDNQKLKRNQTFSKIETRKQLKITAFLKSLGATG